MIEELRRRLRGLERPPGLEDGPAALPLGADAVDAVLGGGLMRGALHEIAASSEAHVAAATGFAMGVAARAENALVWIAEEMSVLESGALYGAGLDGFGLAPERLITAAVAQRRDLLWAMEEALRCRAVTCVIGEMRHGALDAVAARRLSLAAAESGALALVLRAAPEDDASTAATRWIVGASPSPGGGGSPSEARRGGVILQKRSPPPGALTRADLPPPGGGEEKESAPRFTAALIRNRRGVRGQWILEWSDSDGRFALAAHAQPVAQPARHRPHCKVA